jgi:general secretion pathway protein D
MTAKSLATRLLSSLLILNPLTSWAQNDLVSFRFDQMPLDKAAQIVLGEVVKTPYVLAADLKEKAEPITLDIVGVSKQQAAQIFSEYLRVKGYDYKEKQGIVWILPQSEVKEPISIWSYFPKNRKATYLMEALGSIFSESLTQRNSGLSQGPNAPNQPLNSAASNSLQNSDVMVFKGTDQQHKDFLRLVEGIDTPVKQAEIAALIIELQNDDLVVDAFQAAINLFNSKVSASVGSTSSGLFTGKVSVFGIDLLASMLSVDSRFKLVSKPLLRAVSGSKSAFQVGTETPVITSDSLDNQGRPFRTVDYKQSGVIFEITPTIFKDHLTVDVSQIVSDFVKTNTGVSDSPTLIKREVKSTVALKNGEVVVLGSLSEDKNTSSTSGFSFIRLGQSSEKSNRSLVLILQARII